MGEIMLLASLEARAVDLQSRAEMLYRDIQFSKGVLGEFQSMARSRIGNYSLAKSAISRGAVSIDASEMVLRSYIAESELLSLGIERQREKEAELQSNIIQKEPKLLYI